MNYQTENVNELFTALAKAQGKITSASKETKGYNYKYADLASVWDACRAALSENGLSVTHIEAQNELGDILITILNHSSGQWIRSITPIRVKPSGKMNELQDRGSVLTYLKRYALTSIVGVAPAEDDDGKGGSGYQSKPEVAPISPPTVKMATEFQASQLKKEMENCSQEFKDKIAAYMLKFNLKTYQDLNESNFLYIMKNAIEDQKIQKKKIEVAQ
jgi:hypothetical protein